MSRARRGIFIAEPGQSVGRGSNNRYESDRPHLQVNLVRDPPHLDIREFSGGTAFMGNGSTPSNQEEVLFPIPHGLPYTPEVLLFLYAISYNGSTTDPHAGSYAADVLLLSGSGGTLNDLIFGRVDSENLYIMHAMYDYTGLSYTSDANKYFLRLKYYILSNDSGAATYDTFNP